MTIFGFLDTLLGLINDNIGLVTLLVGGFAIYLYLRQRKDKKRDAAGLILQEIRYAEQQIRNSQRGARGYSLSSKLLPTNSWNDNIHLFIKDLKETEIDLISGFYSQATFIDYLIAERAEQKLHQQFEARPVPPAQGDTLPPELTQQQIAQLVQVPNPNEQITVGILNDISRNIEYLYNTPAVDKLRKIAERKWYEII